MTETVRRRRRKIAKGHTKDIAIAAAAKVSSRENKYDIFDNPLRKEKANIPTNPKNTKNISSARPPSSPPNSTRISTVPETRSRICPS